MADLNPSDVSPLTRTYAEFAAGMAHRTLPAPVRQVAILGFTDALGVMLAGARELAVTRLTDWVIEQGGAPRCWLVNRTERTQASQAALVNATAAHALDVARHAKDMHGTIGMPIRLEALEARTAVMQSMRCGVDLERTGVAELGRPPSAVAIVCDRHGACEHAAERGVSGIRVHRGDSITARPSDRHRAESTRR